MVLRKQYILTFTWNLHFSVILFTTDAVAPNTEDKLLLYKLRDQHKIDYVGNVHSLLD